MNVAAISQSLASPAGTTIKEALPLLQLRHPVTPGALLNLYFVLEDRQDTNGASAVALDNFAWITDTTVACAPDKAYSGDQDGDGLPDGWEKYGAYALNGSGALARVDLPGLGARPDVKDIFVELDALGPLPTTIHPDGLITPQNTKIVTYDPQPLPAAVAKVIDAFAHAPVDSVPGGYTGIRLHVDYGKQAPLGTSPGGSQVGGASLPFLCITCTQDLDAMWSPFDTLKHENFAIERLGFFHYGLFVHSLAACPPRDCNLNRISGISRNFTDTDQGASDFVVSLGHKQWWYASDATTQAQYKVDAQAGTFMHELGHNLGLNHYGIHGVEDAANVGRVIPYGSDPHKVTYTGNLVPYKPNHLSVMNYLYQTLGIMLPAPAQKFDYLRYNMAPLDEHHLAETDGLRLSQSNMPIPDHMGVRFQCKGKFKTAETTGAVDWNCKNGANDTDTINVSGDMTDSLGHPGSRNVDMLSNLVVQNEWNVLVFTGGYLNRQRSLLYPYAVQRRPFCPSLGLVAPQSPPGPPPGPWSEPWLKPPPPTEAHTQPRFFRRLITPAPVDTAPLARQARKNSRPK